MSWQSSMPKVWPQLAVFVKAARIGGAKTRLARDIGSVPAVSLYRHMSAALLRTLGRDPRWQTSVFVSPDRDLQTAGQGLAPWPSGLTRFPQGSGNLGAKLKGALDIAPPGPLVIIGSDCPFVTRRHIAGAFKALQRAEVVFGPAEDGGYWLVGLKRSPALRRLFEAVRWSTAHALEDTLANVPKDRRVEMLETLYDIDTGADFRRWRETSRP